MWSYDGIIPLQIEYFMNRVETDKNLRWIHNTRSRVHQVLSGKTKLFSAMELLGVDIDSYKKWIEFQMTPDNNWWFIEIDHVKPIFLFMYPMMNI